VSVFLVDATSETTLTGEGEGVAELELEAEELIDELDKVFEISTISSSSSKSGTGNFDGSGEFMNADEAKCITSGVDDLPEAEVRREGELRAEEFFSALVEERCCLLFMFGCICK